MSKDEILMNNITHSLIATTYICEEAIKQIRLIPNKDSESLIRMEKFIDARNMVKDANACLELASNQLNQLEKLILKNYKVSEEKWRCSYEQ